MAYQESAAERLADRFDSSLMHPWPLPIHTCMAYIWMVGLDDFLHLSLLFQAQGFVLVLLQVPRYRVGCQLFPGSREPIAPAGLHEGARDDQGVCAYMMQVNEGIYIEMYVCAGRF